MSPDPIERMLAERRHREAIAAARAALCKQPDALIRRLQLARALLGMRRDEEAQIELEACTRRHPYAAEPHRRLAELCIRQSAFMRARWHLFEALRLEPHDEASRLLVDAVSATSHAPFSGDEITVMIGAFPPAPRRAQAPSLLATGTPSLTGWQRPFRGWRSPGKLAVMGGLAVALLTTLGIARRPHDPPAAAPLLVPVAMPVATPLSPSPSATACTDPAPTQATPALATSTSASSDRWIHPLAGPVRRMPMRDSRVFGAERPGDRPGECRSGHCGVDLGGDIYKEPVMAVHDGVIDRIQRGPNPLHGGRYVRVAHRGGTLFTWYFHLASIPKELEVGQTVQVGKTIGLLGRSGVKQSGPHLHFAVTVAPPDGGPEQYIDPEPLVALWGLSTPGENGEPIVDAEARPGVPIGRPMKRFRKRARAPQVIARAG